METTTVTAIYALLLLVGLPLLAAHDARQDVDLEQLTTHRTTVYVSIAVSLLVVASITAGIAIWQKLPPESLGWRVEDPFQAIAWAVVATGAGFGVALGASRVSAAFGWPESRIAYYLMPRSPAETRGFLLLAGLGAICEEYVYRGFLLHATIAWIGNPWLAVGLTSISFGFAHGYQRAAGITRAGLLGVIISVPVVLSGSLFPAVVAHFWINAIIGMGGWRLMLDEASFDTEGSTDASPEDGSRS